MRKVIVVEAKVMFLTLRLASTPTKAHVVGGSVIGGGGLVRKTAVSVLVPVAPLLLPATMLLSQLPGVCHNLSSTRPFHIPSAARAIFGAASAQAAASAANPSCARRDAHEPCW